MALESQKLELSVVVSCSAWVLGNRASLLQEQLVFPTAEPSLQGPQELNNESVQSR